MSIEQSRYRVNQIEYVPLERIGYNNITLTPLPLDHWPELWQDHEQLLRRAVNGADYTILEYFPFELERTTPEYSIPPELHKKSWWKDEFYYQYYQFSVKPYFDQFSEITKQKPGHGILTLDPARSKFYAYMFNHQVPKYLQSLGLAWALSNCIKSEKITRRQFFKYSHGILSLALASSIVFDIKQLSDEDINGVVSQTTDDAFRRAVVAEGIDKISTIPGYSGANINILYPPVHLQGILHLLRNPVKRRTILGAFQADAFMMLPYFRNTFFSANEFRWSNTNQSWEQARKIAI